MPDKKQEIHIITTGGTIDKIYCPSEQNNVFKQKSGIPDFFKERIDHDVTERFTQLMMIDSLDMKDEHRATLLQTIEDISEDRIMITHGTDTMIQTAQYVQQHIKNKNKLIIFVGSMIPMDGFYYSDAGFNLGYAFSCAQHAEAGVYVCMNGQKFTPDTVQKNVQASRFEEKSAA